MGLTAGFGGRGQPHLLDPMTDSWLGSRSAATEVGGQRTHGRPGADAAQTSCLLPSAGKQRGPHPVWGGVCGLRIRWSPCCSPAPIISDFLTWGTWGVWGPPALLTWQSHDVGGIQAALAWHRRLFLRAAESPRVGGGLFLGGPEVCGGRNVGTCKEFLPESEPKQCRCRAGSCQGSRDGSWAGVSCTS